MDKQARREELYGLLGDLPKREYPVSARLLSTEERDGYILETLLLDLNGIEAVPAYFAKPAQAIGSTPAILYNHSHGGYYDWGKRELIDGQSYLMKPPYAKQLTSMGYSVLCIDTWAFGERRGRTESEIFKLMLWSGQVMWGMMVFDSLKAVDYLTSRPDVDADRIGTLGISMGSTMAWWVAALDERIKVCVDICCLTDYQALIEAQGLDGHGLFYFVPSLIKHFTTAQINALIAPRPHLALAGNYDRLTPAPGLNRIDAELKKVYASQNAPEAWQLVRYDTGHLENADMRVRIVEFLKKWM